MSETRREEQGVSAGVDDDLSPTALLASIRSARVTEDAASARQLTLAARWADLHPPEWIQSVATFSFGGGLGREHEEPIAGPGCPLVAEFCVAELGTVLGVSTVSAKKLIAHALDLRHRLPRLWSQVRMGRVPAWWARLVAEADIDIADALDLDRAITHGAASQKALGSGDSLNACRAEALGELARAQTALDLFASGATGSRTEDGLPVAREVVLHAHFNATTSNDDESGQTVFGPTGRLEEDRSQPGPSSTSNLAALCRFHHRLKTTGVSEGFLPPGLAIDVPDPSLRGSGMASDDGSSRRPLP